ncbi:hypothetical protein NPIL_346661 [Nephila pilipes]|uniref:Uncharacterized protein n=1 Tax=Nephila pilipes TaxID=299642 RepID=A0A8X6MZU4_NEPPI|nr:hypothetical protein NPIL_346661 [Nephila pilipes]
MIMSRVDIGVDQTLCHTPANTTRPPGIQRVPCAHPLTKIVSFYVDLGINRNQTINMTPSLRCISMQHKDEYGEIFAQFNSSCRFYIYKKGNVA